MQELQSQHLTVQTLAWRTCEYRLPTYLFRATRLVRESVLRLGVSPAFDETVMGVGMYPYPYQSDQKKMGENPQEEPCTVLIHHEEVDKLMKPPGRVGEGRANW